LHTSNICEPQLDEAVRVAVYDSFIHTGAAPDPAALAEQLGVAADTLVASYHRLAEQRALVLDADGVITMAIPFSASPTAVRVVGPGVTWWANCAYDGLGIPAMLSCDAVVATACPQSGAPITVTLRAGMPQSLACVLHMAVPLAQWWDNIGDT
jgi:Alkylmercury lyase